MEHSDGKVYGLKDLQGMKVRKEVLMEAFGFDSVQMIYRLKEQAVIEPCGAIGTGKRAEQVYDLLETARKYAIHLRDRAFRRGVDEKQAANANDADLRLRVARAEKAELELSELKGRMHSAEDVEAVVGDMIAKLRAEILSLPGGLAKDVMDARTPAEASGIIKAAVNDLLNRMSQYRYDEKEFQRRVRRREKWMNEQKDGQGERE